MTWRPIQDQSAVRESTIIFKHDVKDDPSFLSDERLAQVDNSELSKFTCDVYPDSASNLCHIV